MDYMLVDLLEKTKGASSVALMAVLTVFQRAVVMADQLEHQPVDE